MKSSMRARIFLPFLLLMILLPVSTYLIFGTVASQYTLGLARSEMLSTLDSVRSIVDQIYGEYDTGDEGLTEAMQKAQAREFLYQTRSALRRSQFEASVIVLNRHYEQVYPDEPDAETTAITGFFSAHMAADSFDDAQERFVEIEVEGRSYLASLLRLTDPENVQSNFLIAYTSITDMGALMATSALFVLLITAVFSLAALWIAWLLATSIASPIRRLRDLVAQIGAGEFLTTEQKSGIIEVDALIDATNGMSCRLKKHDAAQKTFFQNASHELRTPLMSIQGYAEGIELGVWNDAAQAAGVIAEESRALNALVDELLTLSRLDNDQQSVDIEPIDLRAFVDNTLNRLRGMALKQGTALVLLPGADAARVLADEQLLTKSVVNVLSNALRYAKSRVTVWIREGGGSVRLYIADDGAGIADKDAEHVFDRFFKGKEGHSGIGLSLARSSMEYMRGSIRLVPSDGGATFELVFCAAPLSSAP